MCYKMGDVITVGGSKYVISDSVHTLSYMRLVPYVEPTYKIGDIFEEASMGDYIIARVGIKDVLFVSLTGGNNWTNPVTIVDPYSITLDEIKKMSGDCGEFTYTGKKYDGS